MLILLLSTISLLLLPISPLPTTVLPIATSMILLSLFSATLAYSQQSMLLFSSSFLMDTMSVSLIFLTLWIAALMILASTPAIKNQARPVALLTLITALSITLLVAFTATNIMLFYVSFEASLIPTLLLIIGWGYQPERLQAGMYLMLYTITASLPLLLALLFMYTKNGHLMLTLRPSCPQLTPFMMKLWWAAMITAFLVKMPMFLVHLWLPKAHVEAPVAGSMVLAGILLKLGGYGLLRISSMFPQLSLLFMPLLSAISLWGAAVCSLICLRQPDLKSLIAYSSVGHMGLLTAGAMTQSLWGLQGALAMMIAHGLCSPALFAIANSTYESTSSRSLFLTKGMLNLFPMMSMWWFLLVATNMAAPPSINLMSEILLLSTILSSSPITLLALGPISFLAAAYSLHLFTSTQHGQPSKMFNPMIMNPRSSSLSMLHLLPLLMMILKPEMITNWT